jgi:hypothetical protein
VLAIQPQQTQRAAAAAEEATSAAAVVIAMAQIQMVAVVEDLATQIFHEYQLLKAQQVRVE